MLRRTRPIDVNSGSPYAIPPTNPFIGTVGAQPEIWTWGFRNPWRSSFDRRTGDLFIGDVGQSAREEVDLELATSGGGGNYGWRKMEGTACYIPSTGCNDGTLILPILDYPHASGDCSITGGYVYRGTAFPELAGRYFYGDYCTGRIWIATRNADGTWSTTQALDTSNLVSTFGQDEAGELYVSHHSSTSGAIYRIIKSAP